MLHIRVQKQLGNFALAVDIQGGAGVTALFGRSGCGKSTTINLIAGLLRPDGGRVQLDDQVLFDADAGIDVPCEQRRIGVVFQEARLFPHYTVAGNLKYGLKRSRQHLVISFDDVVSLLGLAALLERRPQQLSGGEKQRVALGRALLAQPRLLLLDEPLASLDQARRAEVLPYLERVRDQLHIPMVYVSHQFEEVLQLASTVALLDNGQVLAQGDLPAISHLPQLRSMIGAEAMGTVVEAQVQHIDAHGLARVTVGKGAMHVEAAGLRAGQRVRLQLLARDLILSLHAPQGLSVRNSLAGVVTRLVPDEPHAMLVYLDVGAVELVARITTPAALEMQLQPGMLLWALIKSVTLRGHVFHRD